MSTPQGLPPPPGKKVEWEEYVRLHKIVSTLDRLCIVAITDGNGTITYVNEKFCKISKYTREELIGQNHRILKSGYHSPEFYQGMWKVISSGHTWENVIKNKAKDGTFYYVKTIIVPIHDLTGKISEYVSIRTDISDQKNTEEKLQQTLKLLFLTEAKYRGLFEESPDMYRIINMDGIILECNRSYGQKLGYSKDEIIGKSIFDHVSEKDVEALRDSFETWKRTGKTSDREIGFKRKDGTTFPTLLSATTIYDESGNVLGSNTIIRDITEQKELQTQLLKAGEMYVIGALSARLAHDLRNPLSIIKNTIGMIKIKNPDLAESILKDLHRTNLAVSRMTHQIDDVLDYVRPKTLTLNKNKLSEILNLTIERITIPDTIKINLPKNDRAILCDGEKMETVFVNLITNAIQGMSNKGEIDIRIIEEKEQVIIEVEDTGPGIPPDILPKIFDPLFTTKQIGTGLGLVSCKSIVERHEGKINVRTEVGKGTTFVISLPLSEYQHKVESI